MKLRYLPVLIYLGLCLSLFNNDALAQYPLLPAENYRCSHAHAANPSLEQQYIGGISDGRSDSLDILNYTINLDITDFASKTIKGNCVIQLTPKVEELQKLRFDLEGLVADSVYLGGEKLGMEHNTPHIHIALPTPIDQKDTVSLTIYYGGTPIKAAFGGFYFTSSHAYNLGVGIGIDPPNFGRAWFPCIDNFVERSTYQFNITTRSNHTAICGGMLDEVIEVTDSTKRWEWTLNQTIPTYLASVAVADYRLVEWTHKGLERDIPVMYGVKASDSSRLMQSFQNFPTCVEGFEEAFGPYQFDRIGYVMVPFNGGAMEHATNIAYPNFAINGSLQWEGLMAHEFAHHWWGDLITCESASEMWLNEGWASFCANYFFELAYDKAKYKEKVRENHASVLQYTHVRDGDFLAVAGIPFDVTYGSTVYDKGADVIHSLRSYMGDDNFFRCTSAFLEDHAFQAVNTLQFRDYLSECSNTDLNDYFKDWILQKGFPHFSVDSMEVNYSTDTTHNVRVFIRQKKYGNTEFYNNVPIELTFLDFFMNRHTALVYIDGACSVVDIDIPFFPATVFLDLEEKLADATVDNYQMIRTEGAYDFPNTYFSVNAEKVVDSTLLRITHHMVPPDRHKGDAGNWILSDKHYWTVEGFIKGDFQASGRLTYNGTNSTNGGYLDNNLIEREEKVLKVLHRSSPREDWQKVIFEMDVEGSSTNKIGSITIPNLRFGEYTLAIEDRNRTDAITTFIPECATINTATEDIELVQQSFIKEVRPNPANQSATVLFKGIDRNCQLLVYDQVGVLMTKETLNSGQKRLILETTKWTAGVYFLQLICKEGPMDRKKIVIGR